MNEQRELHGLSAALFILTLAVVAAVFLGYVGGPPLAPAAIGLSGVLAAWLVYWRDRTKQVNEAHVLPGEPQADEDAAVDTACLPDPEREKSLIVSGELSAAHEIQMRLVPHTFPPLPGFPLFDLYALIEPVREIGGDFYDYWMLGRDRLALVIADVSGKGVPAALFMAMTRTYLRAFSRHIHEPNILLERLNREVARNNPGCMFVTVFCGIIHLSTGRMVYSNAGHNPPMRKKPGSDATFFELAGQPPVGFVDGIKYAAKETVLEPGEMVFLYTDGLNEALNPASEEFGEERLRLSFASAASTANLCRAVVMQVRSEMAEHVAGAEQYDDITIMAYRQPENADLWDASEVDAEGEAGDSALMSFSSDESILSRRSLEHSSDGFFSLTDLKKE